MSIHYIKEDLMGSTSWYSCNFKLQTIGMQNDDDEDNVQSSYDF